LQAEGISAENEDRGGDGVIYVEKLVVFTHRDGRCDLAIFSGELAGI
jgi:hypothetical protein